MAEKMERTKYQNVYQRVSATRRNPRDMKPDACIYITYRHEGKKIWEKIGWKSEGITAQLAFQIRADRMRSILNGEPISKGDKPIINSGNLDNQDSAPRGCLTFGEAWQIYAEKWLPNLAFSNYEAGRFNNHIAPTFSHMRLDEIKPLDLENHKLALAKKGLGPGSIKLILSEIRRVYKKMAEWELYDGRIPTAGIKMPKVDNARIRYLTPQEAEKLLSALKKRSFVWWCISFISLYTGLRLAEILSLTWSDLDLSACVIHIRDAKGGTRMAHIPDEVKNIFLEIIPGKPSSLIFPARGKNYRSTHTSKSFSNIVKDLGFNTDITDDRQKVVFHSLRHTFASWLAISGVPIYTISKLLGHASLEMTKRYAHLCPEASQEALKKMSGYVQAAISNGPVNRESEPVALHNKQ